MKKDMEKAEMEKLLKTIEGHPLTKQILAEEADKILEERLLAAAKLRKLEEEAEAVIPEREAELAGYDEGRKVIMYKVTTARLALTQERQRLDRERSEAEAVLLSNYDPRINEGIEFFRERHEALLHKSIDKQTHAGERNLFTEKQEVIVYSNAAAIRNALAYCRAAIDKLEKMKFTPALDVDRIETLKRGIPDISEMTEYTGEKPLSGSRGINPRWLLKSDSELDWEVGKLNEKFKKVMGMTRS